MPALKTNWQTTALLIVAVVTGFRLVALWFSNIDLFVDEAQYWLWGQNLDLGYYSKPPLVAWVIRAVTDLVNSSSPFWIRMPAPLFHGATALILAVWAKREFGHHAAIWVAAAYVTLPIVAAGSVVMSTDTIMAPFFALALLFHSKLVETGLIRHAILAGAMLGLAMMAKYAGVYFLLGAGLAALLLPTYRMSVANFIALVVAATVVLSPNIFWNLANDLTTLDHTLDNVDWVRSDTGGLNLNPGNLAEFFASQFLVMGPILFGTLLLLLWKLPENARGYLLLSVPIIALVCVQALLSRAYANWAFAAYFAATLAVVPWMLLHAKRWLWAGIAFNIAFTLAIPTLTVFAEKIRIDPETPLLIRHLGRDEMSQQILDLAQKNGPVLIVAYNRDVLADLFLTGREMGIPIFSTPPRGRAKNYYQQTYPFVADNRSTVLFVTSSSNLACNDIPVPELKRFDAAGTAYAKSNLAAYLLAPECQKAIR